MPQPQHNQDPIGNALALKGLVPKPKGKHPERILVLPSEALGGYPKWQGYRPIDPQLWNVIAGVDDKAPVQDKDGNPLVTRLEWRVRDEVEHDTGFRQVIPYVVFTNEGQILVYRRPDKDEGEQRLRGKMSCGFGGHVELVDGLRFVDPRNWIQRATFREIDEEVLIALDDLRNLNVVGVIRDDSDDVGQCHLGIVYHCPVKFPREVQANSKEINDLAWMDLLDFQTVVNDDHGPFESWSRVLSDNLSQITRA